MRDIWLTDKISLGMGSDFTFFLKPAILDRIFGNNPVGWKRFLHFRAGKMDMSMHGMHGGMNDESKIDKALGDVFRARKLAH